MRNPKQTTLANLFGFIIQQPTDILEVLIGEKNLWKCSHPHRNFVHTDNANFGAHITISHNENVYFGGFSKVINYMYMKIKVVKFWQVLGENGERYRKMFVGS